MNNNSNYLTAQLLIVYGTMMQLMFRDQTTEIESVSKIQACSNLRKLKTFKPPDHCQWKEIIQAAVTVMQY
jgi:hypothetical protein